MIKTNFHEIKKSRHFLYVVIITRYLGKWVFCRQKGRDTWEVPGGHVERGEAADDAAERELIEETGAVKYEINPICDFSVEFDDGTVNYSRLYYANILELGALGGYEIEELAFREEMPEKLTHPDIQPVLFEKVKSAIQV